LKPDTSSHRKATGLWGRDTFISLPGLLLATGRREEAGSVLSTRAAAADAGMVPSRFDDRTGTAHFNSVDASLS
jgi:glycogen debranching enzyme